MAIHLPAYFSPFLLHPKKHLDTLKKHVDKAEINWFLKIEAAHQIISAISKKPNNISQESFFQHQLLPETTWAELNINKKLHINRA